MTDGDDTIHTDELPWLPLAPQIEVKVITADAETGAYSVMIRAEPGGLLPRHRHLKPAVIYVMQGEGVHPQTGPFRAGDYVTEHLGAVHEELPFHVPTELLMIAEGPSAFLAPDDSTMFMMDVEMLEGLKARYSAAA